MKLTKEQCEIFLLLRQFQAPGKPAGELCLKRWHFQRDTCVFGQTKSTHDCTILDLWGGGLQICHWCHRGQRKVGPSPIGGAIKRQCELSVNSVWTLRSLSSWTFRFAFVESVLLVQCPTWEEFEDLHRMQGEGLGRIQEWRDASAVVLVAKWRALSQIVAWLQNSHMIEILKENQCDLSRYFFLWDLSKAFATSILQEFKPTRPLHRASTIACPRMSMVPRQQQELPRNASKKHWSLVLFDSFRQAELQVTWRRLQQIS